MCKKEEIIQKYYEEDEKIIDISNELKVSRAYISKIIQQDNRYYIKKQALKDKTQERKREYTKMKMRQIREEKSIQNAIIKQQHIQATAELSSGYPVIGNRAFRKWNASAYKYNKSKKCFEFDRKLSRSYAIPKYIRYF